MSLFLRGLFLRNFTVFVLFTVFCLQNKVRSSTAHCHSDTDRDCQSKMAAPISKAEIEAACFEPPEETKGFRMQQVMIRVKDPRTSITFYTKVLGMRLLQRVDCEKLKFTLYFLGYADKSDISQDENERNTFCMNQRGTIELTHNWGTEKEEGPVYHNGNKEPKGFGHLGVVVPDVYAISERAEKLEVPFIMKPDKVRMVRNMPEWVNGVLGYDVMVASRDGPTSLLCQREVCNICTQNQPWRYECPCSLKGVAFIQDPDGYWVELLSVRTIPDNTKLGMFSVMG